MQGDWRHDLNKRIIIDNGANTIRFGTCISEEPSIVLPNLLGYDKKTGQLLTGNNLQNTLEENNINYIKPHIRGVVVDWDNQIHLWEQLLSTIESKEINQSCLLQTFHPGVPERVRLRMFEVAFEYFQFDSFFPALSESMVQQCFMMNADETQINPTFQLVVESSHSATHIVPFFDGEPINHAITRLDVGGKLLTNHFKDLISLRHFDFKNELRLTQQIKEEVCMISEQFRYDMKKPRNNHSKYFVLPDYETGKKGYATDQIDQNTFEQYLQLDKERFTIPEIIFNPSDIGLFENGLSQSILDTVKKLNPNIRDYFLENIIVSGGNSNIPGFTERLQKDIRESTAEHLNIRVHKVQEANPVYQGALDFCCDDEFYTQVIRKQDYRESGFHYLHKIYFA